jgi:tRNA A37 threonylcarbamoyladenosine modification protein TsaB
MSSLALLAAGVGSDGPVAAAMLGGHGELFVQQFEVPGGAAVTEVLNLPPQQAGEAIAAGTVAGPGAGELVRARGWGTAVEAWPSAANALRLRPELRSLAAKPVYARAPDAGTRRAA